MSIAQEEDPYASRPGNMSSHVGPIERMDNAAKFHDDRIRLPGYLVRTLERNKDRWRVTIEAWICENCWAMFFVLQVVIPSEGPFMEYEIERYVFRGDGT